MKKSHPWVFWLVVAATIAFILAPLGLTNLIRHYLLPSMSNVAPVTSEAAGDARKMTAPATSTGSPIR